jgi:hypothetical protein
MTHFPQDIFKNILSYCDDTLERKQKQNMKQICNDISAVYIDSWLFGNMEDEETEPYNYDFANYTSVKFTFTDMTETYSEIGIAWLIRHFHPDDTTLWQGWSYYPDNYQIILQST